MDTEGKNVIRFFTFCSVLALPEESARESVTVVSALHFFYQVPSKYFAT